MPLVRKLGLLRWLLRQLSTDEEDMIAFVAALPEADDDDLQALTEELTNPRTDASPKPLRAEYKDDKQLVPPGDARRILNIPRTALYGLLKRGTFPGPSIVNGEWVGWPREILLQWADASECDRLAAAPHSGYAPFERPIWRKSK
jgi:predicted DNA-binding transcriptional regulator AlpA